MKEPNEPSAAWLRSLAERASSLLRLSPHADSYEAMIQITPRQVEALADALDERDRLREKVALTRASEIKKHTDDPKLWRRAWAITMGRPCSYCRPHRGENQSWSRRGPQKPRNKNKRR